jgi:hypothetical protein
MLCSNGRDVGALKKMLTQDQNIIIYLMLLNGVLFTGLNIIAHTILNPGPKGSKKKGYAFLLAALLVICVQQEHRALIQIGLSPDTTTKVLTGFIIPVFALHLVFYRSREKSGPQKPNSD